MATQPVRVIQWATGGIGQQCLRQILTRPGLQLAGVFTYGAAKEGRDAGEIVGLPACGMRLTRDRDAIVALDADLVLHCPMQHRKMDEHNRDVARLLASGKDVISTIDYFHPGSVGPEWAEPLMRACEEGGSTLMGLGNQPGFVCERLVTTAVAMCQDIDHIHVLERMDCSNISEVGYPVMGYGMTPDEFGRADVIGMWHHMYRQVPHAVCAVLGVTVDRVEHATKIGLAERDLTHTRAPVRKGTVAATAFSWTAIVRGKPFFTLEVRWPVDVTLPGWEAENDWVVTVEGRPSLRMTFERAHSYAGGRRRGGSVRDTDFNYYECSHMSAAGLLVNAIPDVIAAPQGHLLAPVFGSWKFNGVGVD